ncbi:MAG TPA: hypothetical protein VIF12_01100 [Micavibrio sp.]|jgi:hypothetical protein
MDKKMDEKPENPVLHLKRPVQRMLTPEAARKLALEDAKRSWDRANWRVYQTEVRGNCGFTGFIPSPARDM